MVTSNDQREVYLQYGITAEKAQLLETEAGNVALTFLTLCFDPDKITEEQRVIFKSVIDDVNRQTLGALLRHLKSIFNFDQTILDSVDAALNARNYLIHKFFRSHNFALFGEEGRVEMIRELKDIQGQLDLAKAMLVGISTSLEKLGGKSTLSEECINDLIARGKKVKI